MNETLNKLKEKVKIERRYLIPGASVGILLSVILLWALITKIFIPGNRYNGAARLLQAGKYQQAMESFTALGDFRDAPEQVKACPLCLRRRAAEPGALRRGNRSV